MVPRNVMHQGLNLIHSPAMLSIAEADFLYDVAAGLPFTQIGDPWKQWVELGVWCGRSLWAAGCGLPAGSNIDGFDLFEGRLPRREGSTEILDYAPPNLQEHSANAVATALRAMRPMSRFSATLHKQDSASVPDDDWSVDVLVVDAAHDYASVCRDLDAWLPEMGLNGLVIGHDYGGKFHGVTRAFDERFGDKVQAVPGTRFCRVQL